MNYTRVNWKDDITPVNACNLNKMDLAIFRIADLMLTSSEVKSGFNIEVIPDNMGNITINQKRVSINNCILEGNLTGDMLGLVSKECGKGLTSNDFTDDLKSKLDLLPSNESLSGILYEKVDKHSVYNKTEIDNKFNEYYTKEEVDKIINDILSQIK